MGGNDHSGISGNNHSRMGGNNRPESAFRRDTCIVGIARLAKSVVMSKRKLQETITYLEGRGLIKRLRSIMGGPSKGNVYRVFVPSETMAHGATVAGDATVAGGATVAPCANNKYDDDIKIKSSSKGEKAGVDTGPVENHSCAAAPRERKETADDDLSRVRAAYEKATGNRWNKSDSEAYHQHGIAKIPIEKTLSVLEAVARRTPTRINSFKYFVREIVAPPDPHNRAWHKQRLKKIVSTVSDISVGHADFSLADFVEDVKCRCAREDIVFDNDIFNELVG
jgi:hypothetical protein